MSKSKNNYCILYRLHKDNSPVGVICDSEEEQTKELSKLKKEGYKNAFRATLEQVDKALEDFGKQFEPKPLTRQERWIQWALGK